MIRSTMVATALAAFTFSTAQAQSNGAYAYAAIGAAKTGVQCSAGNECDEVDTSLSAGGGYRFSSGFSLEGFVASFGKVRGVLNGNPAQIETSALGAGATYQFNLADSLSLLARLGLARMNTGVRPIIVGAPEQGRRSDSYFKPMLGLEANWSVSKQLDLSVALTAWKTTALSQDLTITSGSAGLRVRF